MNSGLVDFIKKNNVVQHGNFRLASGKESDLYIDAKALCLDAEGLACSIPDLFRRLVSTAKFHAVGGMELGAVPIVGAMLMHVSSYVPGMTPFNTTLKGFVVRKQPKEHGTQKFIEGPVTPGMHVAIVEDVTTTGASAKLAIERAKQFGLIPVVVGTIVNRKEGADELFKEMGIPFVYLVEKSEL